MKTFLTNEKIEGVNNIIDEYYASLPDVVELSIPTPVMDVDETVRVI